MAAVSEPVADPRPLPGTVWLPTRAWVHVVIAALAMVATLPGRTHGLGLITEPLLSDLHIDRVAYADLNQWATLLGATFCVPWGWLIDRLGTRVVLTGTLFGLGAVVVAMSQLRGEQIFVPLFVLVLLTRGLGQSALSVVSITLMGKSSGRRPGLSVGVYSFLTALGFMAAFALVKTAFEVWGAGWRELWEGIGLHLIVLSAVAWLLVRSPKETDAPSSPEPADDMHSLPSPPPQGSEPGGEGVKLPAGPSPLTPTPLLRSGGEGHFVWKPFTGEAGAESQRSLPAIQDESLTLGSALLSPAFWVFGLATSLYGMIAAGVSLFNQSILQERGFDRSVFLTITTVTPLIGLASNLATGWLASRWSPGRLTALAMAVLTAALLAFPFVGTLTEVYLYAAAMGVAGGMVTVLFFGIWRRAFGTTHLGKIQGAAQMLTVFASALGPELLARCQRWTGSYVPLYQYFALASGLLAVCAWWVPLPRRSPQ
jgi:MFS family permease